MLIDFQSYFAHKDEIYGKLWEYYRVDSLHAYGDYDESAMFAYATALVVESFYRFYLSEKDKVVFPCKRMANRICCTCITASFATDSIYLYYSCNGYWSQYSGQ